MSGRKKAQIIDSRKFAITLLVAVFTIAPVVHVATYTGSFEPAGYEWLGYVYAIGLDFGIAVCAWLTRWPTTARAAWVSYVILVFIDGGLNIAHVQPGSSDNNWAWLYAVSPTVIVALLSYLARKVDALSDKNRKASVGGAFSGALVRLFGSIEPQEVEDAPKPAPKPAYPCTHCGASFDTSNGLSAHLRWCDAYQAQKG